MSVAAETAIQAWVNARTSLVGGDAPLGLGAYLAGAEPRSPADGAYALLSRGSPSRTGLVAEDTEPSVARITAEVRAGTIEAAEAAAVALGNAWNSLNGCPEPCGDTGVTVLVSDNVTEPSYQPTPASSGEPFCFTVAGDFVLMQQ
jgi:hypothetical protein